MNKKLYLLILVLCSSLVISACNSGSDGTQQVSTTPPSNSWAKAIITQNQLSTTPGHYPVALKIENLDPDVTVRWHLEGAGILVGNGINASYTPPAISTPIAKNTEIIITATLSQNLPPLEIEILSTKIILKQTTSSTFKQAFGAVIDHNGDLIITDSEANNQLQVISKSGQRYIPKLALKDNLISPTGIVATDGYLFVADSNSGQIFQITPNGEDTEWPMFRIWQDERQIKSKDDTKAKQHIFPHKLEQLAIDKSGTHLYFTDSVNNELHQLTNINGTWSDMIILKDFITQRDGSNISGNHTILNHPSGVAVDNIGNVFIADTRNNRILELKPNANGTWPEHANIIAQGLNGPTSLAIDNKSNLYITNTKNNVIDKLSLSNGTWVLKTIAGTGAPGSHDDQALKANFNEPYGIAIDTDNNILITSYADYTIRKILYPDQADSTVITIAK